MRTVSRIPQFQQEVKKDIEEKLWKAGFMVEGDAKRLVPVDTGNLRSSIHTYVDNLTARIGSVEEISKTGTIVNYAPYVELGTYRMVARPFLRPAFENNRARIAGLFHAGSI